MKKTKRQRIKKICIIIGWSLFAFLNLWGIRETFGFFYLRMTHLSDQDLEWIECVKKYPTAKFKSNLGNISELVYTDISINNSTNRFYFSTNVMDDFEANAWYFYTVKDLNIDLEGSFSIKRAVSRDSLWFTSRLGAMSTTHRQISVCPITVIINEKQFENCIIVDTLNARNLANKEKQIYMDKFVISKEYGLIYYKLKTGEEFCRQFLSSDSLKSGKQLK